MMPVKRMVMIEHLVYSKHPPAITEKQLRMDKFMNKFMGNLWLNSQKSTSTSTFDLNVQNTGLLPDPLNQY